MLSIAGPSSSPLHWTQRALAAEEQVKILKAAYLALRAQLTESQASVARQQHKEQAADDKIGALQAAREAAEARAALAEARAQELEAKFRALKSALLEAS
jgi:hypothetical protein